MPNGRIHKKWKDYGSHSYDVHGTSDCKNGCGCWCGPARSEGPPGIDPMGRCPNNPKDGKPQEGKDDYIDLVNGRLAYLESKIHALQPFEEIVIQSRKNSKVDLVEKNKNLRHKIKTLHIFIHDLFESIDINKIKYDDIK